MGTLCLCTKAAALLLLQLVIEAGGKL